MGAGTSKDTSQGPEHVFSASTPTRFSPNLISSLEDSPQSDSTRSTNLELKIQQRVSAELEKLAAQESERLKSTTKALSEEAPADESSPSLVGGILDSAEQKKKASLSHDSVAKEVEELRKKLAERRKVEHADAEVESARSKLVYCLRVNDRRPLDCWKEREEFKKAVGRLERDFVEKTIR